jgi:hypothetical protein
MDSFFNLVCSGDSMEKRWAIVVAVFLIVLLTVFTLVVRVSFGPKLIGFTPDGPDSQQCTTGPIEICMEVAGAIWCFFLEYVPPFCWFSIRTQSTNNPMVQDPIEPLQCDRLRCVIKWGENAGDHPGCEDAWEWFDENYDTPPQQDGDINFYQYIDLCYACCVLAQSGVCSTEDPDMNIDVKCDLVCETEPYEYGGNNLRWCTPFEGEPHPAGEQPIAE